MRARPRNFSDLGGGVRTAMPCRACVRPHVSAHPYTQTSRPFSYFSPRFICYFRPVFGYGKAAVNAYMHCGSA